MFIKDFLIEIYLEYANNYLTVEKFAEHQELNVKDIEYFINLGKKIYHNEYKKED